MVYICIIAGFNTPEHNTLWKNIRHYDRVMVLFIVALFMIAVK